MSEIDDAMGALAERGLWVSKPRPDADMVRVELRRSARKRGIRIRTGINVAGYLFAVTPDGLPAEEPWRGAEEHAHQSDAWHDSIQMAWRRMRDEMGEPPPSV